MRGFKVIVYGEGGNEVADFEFSTDLERFYVAATSDHEEILETDEVTCGRALCVIEVDEPEDGHV